jgi:uncharacterized iron-regulated protein
MPSFLKRSVTVLVALTTACTSAIEPPASELITSQPAHPLPSGQTNAITPPAEILSRLATAQVVYLGETHDSAADHAAQLEIIQALQQQHGTVAIALEMIQRPFQPVLDAYLSGEINEAELITQSEYETRWGYSWELYAPIFRYALANQLPLLALNTPREVTRKVAREGLTSLTGDELRYIPPLDQIDTTNEAYKAFVAGVAGFHSRGSHGEFNFDHFFAAQVLWDETMAATISEFAQANPEIPIIALAGQGHVIYDFGIPSRVQRRLGEDLVHYSVLLNPSPAILSEGQGAIADFFWINPD